MNILLVDDDAEIRLIAGFVLRAAGHTVVEADGAAAAAAALAEAPADVMLMDVMLGDDDGVAVAMRLCAAVRDPPRLVFLTGASRPDQVQRLHAARPIGVLHKPFDASTLESELQRLLDAADLME